MDALARRRRAPALLHAVHGCGCACCYSGVQRSEVDSRAWAPTVRSPCLATSGGAGNVKLEIGVAEWSEGRETTRSWLALAEAGG